MVDGDRNVMLQSVAGSVLGQLNMKDAHGKMAAWQESLCVGSS